MEFGNIDSQTPANKEAVNSGNCLPVNLDIKGNDLDHTAIQNLKEKSPSTVDSIKNLENKVSALMNEKRRQ